MTLLRPRWIDDEVRPEEVVRLDERDHRIVLATEAQRVSGGLAFALEVGDASSVMRLSGRLRALSEALSPNGSVAGLVPGECVRVDAAEREFGARLFVGGTPSFWDGLRPLLRDASALDIVVAYATTGGIDLLRRLLLAPTSRPLRLRMLLGSYLGGTRPEALRAAHALFRSRQWESGSVLRLIADPARHFHPKVYRVVDDRGRRHLAVGSANLSRSALDGADAVEWNALFDGATSASLLRAAETHLDRLLTTEGEVVDETTLERLVSALEQARPPALMLDPEIGPLARPEPNPAQLAALTALEGVRAEGYDRALVVAATGLGKTILAALDSLAVVPPRGGRVLFVAHREELLLQARRAFENVRGSGESTGLVKQHEQGFDADLVFASVFSLDRIPREQLAAFDYVVVDEAHHAAAKSYEALFSSTKARFILGLTATPDRQDGGDIYALFDGVVAYEMPLLDAIAADMLVPFRYFGIPDTVDYSSLAWVGGSVGYREAELERAVIDDARMSRVIFALATRGREGLRTLFFCVSIPHASHTAESLRKAGLRVARVDSGPSSDDRATAIDALDRGTIDAIVSVDMFNEGIDVPSIDRIVLLRPTDSRTVFLQQLGRGLRKHSASAKTHLTVIDLVGNHRRVREHLALLGLPSGDLASSRAREALRWQVGKNEIFLEPEAIDAVRAVGGARSTTRERLLDAVRDLSERAREEAVSPARPRLVEVLAHTGLALRTVRVHFGSWLGLLEAAGHQALSLSAGTRTFLEELESTSMTGPHKMLFVAALAAERRLDASVEEAAAWMREVARVRHPAVKAMLKARDAQEWLESGAPSTDIPRRYPMQVLAEGHPRFFRWVDGRLVLTGVDVAPPFFDLLREIADARLFELSRRSTSVDPIGTVLPQGRGLTLQVARDADRIGAEGTWVRLVVDGEVFHGMRRKIAINRIQREAGEGENLATQVLQRAAEASSVVEARGRRLRFTPDPLGGFSLELVGVGD